MKLNKKDQLSYSMYLMYGALTSVVFAGLGWLGTDIWLASTQWLLVAVVMALFGVYLKLGK